MIYCAYAVLVALLIFAWSGAVSWFAVPVARFGTLGDWISGLGTVAAVVVALRESALAQSRQRIDRLCAVTAWMELERHEDGSPRWTVFVSNETKHPIYRWLVVPRSDGGDDGVWHLCDARLGPLVPGPTQYEVPHSGGADFHTASPVELQFVDRDGQSWLRTSRGRLEELDGDLGASSCEHCAGR